MLLNVCVSVYLWMLVMELCVVWVCEMVHCKQNGQRKRKRKGKRERRKKRFWSNMVQWEIFISLFDFSTLIKSSKCLICLRNKTTTFYQKNWVGDIYKVSKRNTFLWSKCSHARYSFVSNDARSRMYMCKCKCHMELRYAWIFFDINEKSNKTLSNEIFRNRKN